MTRHLLASASLLAISSIAYAQDAAFDLDEIIVSVSEAPIAENRTGVTVDVLNDAAITEAPQPRVVETLGTLPGVTFSGNGPTGANTAVSIRGLPARYVGTRLYGIDVSNPSSVQTQYNIGALTSAGIGRIEVSKGAQSAIYGSEAIGGVIDIRPPQLSEDGSEIRFGLEYGSFDTARADVTFLQKTGIYDLSLTLSRLVTDGFSAADENDGNTEADGYAGTTALLSAGIQATPDLRFGIDLIYLDEALNIDGFGGAGGDADRPFFTEQKGVRLSAIYDTGPVYHEAALSAFDFNSRDPLTPFGSPTFNGKRTELKYDGRVVRDAVTLSFGAEYSEEEATFSNGTFSYSNVAAFGEVQYAVMPEVDVSAALRLDDHSEFGSAVTWRLAGAWRASDATVVTSSLGTGFRAPSLNELFGPFNFAGTPTLEPEESLSFDLGIRHEYASGAEVEAVFFYSEVDNLISYPVNGYAQVAGTTRSRGLEFAGRVPLSDGLDLFGAYTLTEARNPDGTQTRRVPRHDLVVGIEGDLSARLSGILSVQHIAGRAPDGFPAGPMPDYTVTNAQVTYAVSDTVDAYLRVENLFDTEYQTSAGYGTSDRAFYVGLRAVY